MAAAKILADDGNYKLRYAKRSGLYKAGCREFTFDQAIEHWTRRCSFSDCPPMLPRSFTRQIRKRAKLFLKAIKKHAAEQSQ